MRKAFIVAALALAPLVVTSGVQAQQQPAPRRRNCRRRPT